MLKDKTYRKKMHLALVSLGLLLIVVYFFNIQKTFALYLNYKHLRRECVASNNSPQKKDALKLRLDDLNNILGSKFECTELPEEIVELTNSFTRLGKGKVTLIEVAEWETIEQKNMNLCSFSVLLTGSYNNLIKYIYELETKYKVGRISSAEFLKQKSKLNKKKKELTLQLYIQNIEIN